uniref:Uncharacterized protein n=1 Tax=Anguilla anguilla TaxID=7936 RepID=A0A0E9RYD6_ANGAN
MPAEGTEELEKAFALRFSFFKPRFQHISGTRNDSRREPKEIWVGLRGQAREDESTDREVEKFSE